MLNRKGNREINAEQDYYMLEIPKHCLEGQTTVNNLLLAGKLKLGFM